MNISFDPTIAPEADVVRLLLDALYGGPADPEPTPAPKDEQPAETPKPRRRRRTKAEIEADKAAEADAQEAIEADRTAAAASEPEPEPEQFDVAVDTPDAPTVKDAIEAAMAAVKSGSQAAVKAALVKAGAPRVSELAPEQVPAFLAALS